MEIMSSHRREGIEIGRQEGRQEGRREGLHEGKEGLLGIMLEQRFSTLPSSITEQLDRLTSEQLDDLGRSIFSFDSLTDLERWLDAHGPN